MSAKPTRPTRVPLCRSLTNFAGSFTISVASSLDSSVKPLRMPSKNPSSSVGVILAALSNSCGVLFLADGIPSSSTSSWAEAATGASTSSDGGFSVCCNAFCTSSFALAPAFQRLDVLRSLTFFGVNPFLYPPASRIKSFASP